jgi:predicted transcriptional regulator
VISEAELRAAAESGDLADVIAATAGPPKPAAAPPPPLPEGTVMTQISLRLPRALVETYDRIAAREADPTVDRSALIRTAMYHELARRRSVETAEVEHALEVLRAALLGTVA